MVYSSWRIIPVHSSLPLLFGCLVDKSQDFFCLFCRKIKLQEENVEEEKEKDEKKNKEDR